MRVITCNVNGIRSAVSKGFWGWLMRQKADVICLQEVRATLDKIPPEVLASKYHTEFLPAERPGYSGVALLTKQKPTKVIRGMKSKEFDPEGRYLEVDLDGVRVVSAYFPSGSSGEPRQEAKYRFLDAFFKMAQKKLKEKIIYCGDFNIAHKQIDIKNWKSNQKNSGFLPEERAWMDKLLGVGYVDAFRELNEKTDQYTWWSNRGRAYENNVGWRLDYQVISPALKGAVSKERIYRDKKYSDHAPFTVDYAL